MKIRKKILACIVSFFLVFVVASCGSNEEPEDTIKIKSETVSFEDRFTGLTEKKDGTGENVSFDYAEFNNSAYEENGAITKFAFQICWASEMPFAERKNYLDNSKCIETFYGKLGLKDIYVSPDYNKVAEKDTVAFTMAYKDLGDAKIIFLNVRSSFNGDWQGNFDVGVEGNQHNFEVAANQAYEAITEYVKKFNDTDLIKLLVCGFSKGGAISNRLGQIVDDKIDSKEFTKIKKRNFYAFSFNAPGVIEKTDEVKEYKNINLYYSSYDVVHYLLDNINLGYVGNTHDIYYAGYVNDFNNTYNMQVQSFSEAELDMMSFSIKPKSGGTTDLASFYVIFLKKVFFNSEDGSLYTAGTRQDYVNRVETALEYLVTLAFDRRYDYFGALRSINFENMKLTDILARLTDYENSIVYEKIKEAFDANNLPYDDTKLKMSCTNLHRFAVALFSQYSFDIVNDVATIAYNSSLIASNHSLDGFSLMLDHYFSVKTNS